MFPAMHIFQWDYCAAHPFYFTKFLLIFHLTHSQMPNISSTYPIYTQFVFPKLRFSDSIKYLYDSMFFQNQDFLTETRPPAFPSLHRFLLPISISKMVKLPNFSHLRHCCDMPLSELLFSSALQHPFFGLLFLP